MSVSYRRREYALLQIQAGQTPTGFTYYSFAHAFVACFTQRAPLSCSPPTFAARLHHCLITLTGFFRYRIPDG